MLLSELKNINEMAAASPWATFVRQLILQNPSITNDAINTLVAQANIASPNHLNNRLYRLREEIAKKQGTGVTKSSATKKPVTSTTTKPAPSTTTKPAPSTAATPNKTTAPAQTNTPPPTQPVKTPPKTIGPNDAEYIQKISNWLIKHGANKFTIDPVTYVVDVHDDMILVKFDNVRLPVKFGRIDGDFDVAGVGLTTLTGCPDYVYGRFSCQHNVALKSAVGSPPVVMDSVDFENCPLTSLEGMPKEIHGNLDLELTHLATLSGFNKHIKLIDGVLTLFVRNTIKPDSIMSLMLVKKLKHVNIVTSGRKADAPKWNQALEILNRHLKGDRSGPACQIELIDAGLGDFAKL